MSSEDDERSPSLSLYSNEAVNDELTGDAPDLTPSAHRTDAENASNNEDSASLVDSAPADSGDEQEANDEGEEEEEEAVEEEMEAAEDELEAAEEELEAAEEDLEAVEGEEKSEPTYDNSAIFIQVPHLNDHFDGEVHYVKLPNFLSIEPKVFDEQSFEMEAEDDEVMNEGGRSRVKLKVENTIRWRLLFDEEGAEHRESNAKLVRYSDNSMALFIGAEAFDVRAVPIANEHRHLFIRQGNGLQAAALFETKLVFRPQSINSSTHYKITRNIADKVARTQRVKLLPTLQNDPELDKERLIKAEEERLRTIARKEYQKRRNQQRSYSRQFSGGYLESDKRPSDDDNNETISLAAIKRKYKITAKDFASHFGTNSRGSDYQEDSNYESEEENESKHVAEDDE